jgi:small subunit ribosomal protein S6
MKALPAGQRRSRRRIKIVSERVYEVLFIADPELGEPEVDALTATVQGYIEKEGGRIQKIEKWGKKRLAYMVRRHREGSYVLIVAEGQPSLVKEVERRIRVTDGVVKFITVRVDEELKKAERRKARRTAEEDKRRAKGVVPRPQPYEPAEEVGQ